MPLGLLCLVLTLLGALQTQAQDSAPNFIPAPPLARVPLEEDFSDYLFQGKWYILGVAGNEFQNETHTGIKMYSATYKLEARHSYSVTYTQLSDKGCQHWNEDWFPGSGRGQFNLSKVPYLSNIQSNMVQMVDTNYLEYAIVFFKKMLGNTEYFNIKLYGRTKVLHPILKQLFVLYAKYLDLTDDHIIFTVPIDDCISD